MEIKSNLRGNAMRKIGILLVYASDIGMSCECYGFADENQSSGNVYLWLEDYPFTLYIGLGEDTVYASWECSSDGHEYNIDASEMTIIDLYNWVRDCESGEITE